MLNNGKSLANLQKLYQTIKMTIVIKWWWLNSNWVNFVRICYAKTE